MNIPDSKRSSIRVCAAVIRKDGRVLMCSRPPGSHLAGRWEFPGGKVHAGETDSECLVREIAEELSAEVFVLDLLGRTAYSYQDKDVEIFFYRTVLADDSGKISAMENQEIAWTGLPSLCGLDLVPADLDFARWLASDGE